ncbi:MAG: fimbrillin family protein [Bacteroidales bacterium]|nr:fimbrillin family protein [Bacteroidales bacterium]
MKGLRYIIGAVALAAMASCALDEPAFEPIESEEGLKPIVIAGRIDQEYATRANDEGFCNGDVVGIYVVDYDGDTPGTLQNEGNRADNVRFTFDEAAYKWNPAYEIYWKDKNTHIDIYGDCRSPRRTCCVARPVCRCRIRTKDTSVAGH